MIIKDRRNYQKFTFPFERLSFVLGLLVKGFSKYCFAIFYFLLLSIGVFYFYSALVIFSKDLTILSLPNSSFF